MRRDTVRILYIQLSQVIGRMLERNATINRLLDLYIAHGDPRIYRHYEALYIEAMGFLRQDISTIEDIKEQLEEIQAMRDAEE